LNRLFGGSMPPFNAACAFFSAANLSRPSSDGRAAGWRKDTAYIVSWSPQMVAKEVVHIRPFLFSSSLPSFWPRPPVCRKHHDPSRPLQHLPRPLVPSCAEGNHASCAAPWTGVKLARGAPGFWCVARGWHLRETCRTLTPLNVSAILAKMARPTDLARRNRPSCCALLCP
jgi:hypothetical protein